MSKIPTQPQLESVLNFRDVAVSVAGSNTEPRLKEGMLYRSGNLDNASREDNTVLREDLNIRTIIDLRGSKPVPYIMANNDLDTQYTPHGVAHLQILGLSLHQIQVYGPQWVKHQVSRLSFLDHVQTIGQNIFSRNATNTFSKAIVCKVTSKMNRMDQVNDALDHSGIQIRAIFQILATPSSYPVIICDKYGTGTTSLIICLVLLFLGLDLPSISHDYMRSDAEMLPIREEWLADLRSIGYGDEYADFTEAWVPAIENHLRKYGGAERYLLSIGVKIEELKSLKRILEDQGELPEKAKMLLDF